MSSENRNVYYFPNACGARLGDDQNGFERSWWGLYPCEKGIKSIASLLDSCKDNGRFIYFKGGVFVAFDEMQMLKNC